MSDDETTLMMIYNGPKGKGGWTVAKHIGPSSLELCKAKGWIEVLVMPRGQMMARLTPAGAKRAMVRQ